MRKGRYFLLGAVVLIILVVLLKPSDATIKVEVVKERKSIILPKEAGKEAAIATMIENAAAQGLNIEDHLFYKTVFFSYSAEKRQAGWAALGTVKLNLKGE